MTLLVKQIAVGGLDDNFSYVITTTDGCHVAIVDPCGDTSKIIEALPENGKICCYLLTHKHQDHFDGLGTMLEQFSAPVFSFENLTDGEKIPLGKEWLTAIFTAGHTPDSICFLTSDGESLFTGDTLFVDYIGFGEVEQLYQSLEHLRSLPPHITIYSGHNYGKTPTSTVGVELESNPFFKPQTLDEFRVNYKNLD